MCTRALLLFKMLALTVTAIVVVVVVVAVAISSVRNVDDFCSNAISVVMALWAPPVDDVLN